MSKTYTMYFEGQLEVEADNDEQAIAQIWNTICTGDIGYYRIAETESASSLKEIRIVEEQ